jgi:hypothetical protein
MHDLGRAVMSYVLGAECMRGHRYSMMDSRACMQRLDHSQSNSILILESY